MAQARSDTTGNKCSGRKTWPCYNYLPSHPKYQYSKVKVQNKNDTRVPVSIGPALPRHGRQEVCECYAWVMLILFKPWWHAEDLRSPSQKWSNTFEQFHKNCDPHFIKVMNNMQILHECKDSSIDHFKHSTRLDKLSTQCMLTLQESRMILAPIMQRNCLSTDTHSSVLKPSWEWPKWSADIIWKFIWHLVPTPCILLTCHSTWKTVLHHNALVVTFIFTYDAITLISRPTR